MEPKNPSEPSFAQRVEEALLQTIGGLGRLLNYTLCELTKS